MSEVQKLTVRFENPETHLLHSSVTILAETAAKAVESARDYIHTHYRGAELDYIATYIASVVDEFGQGVPGLERQLSKAQIGARIADLQKHLDALGDDGQTPQQAAAVQQTIPGVQQVVNSPPAVNPDISAPVQPTLYTPPQAAPQSVEVSPDQAPRGTSSPAFSQADVDKAVADALSKTEAAGR